MESTTIKLKFPMARRNASRSSNKTACAGGYAAPPATKTVSKLARMLALAHFIERAIENGVIGTNADAARALGLSRARITQLSNLLVLSPELQARILTGEIAATEHDLRQVVKEADWKTQSEVLEINGTAQLEPSGDAANRRNAI